MNNEVSRASTIIKRHAITEFGAPDAPAIVFAHGYGTSQQMWRLVAPAFAERHRVVLFDHVGSGMSDRSSYSTERYDTLEGYASDLLEIIAELELRDVTYVGHSVSAMIGVIAAVREPSAISRLVMLGASPRYINDGDYVGGFDAADVDALLEAIEANYLGWAVAMAPRPRSISPARCRSSARPCSTRRRAWSTNRIFGRCAGLPRSRCTG
jgi:sigma-B regulation protein RsbQ